MHAQCKSVQVKIVTNTMASSRSWMVQTLQSVICEIDSIRGHCSISVQHAEAIEWQVELVYI